MGAKLAAVVGWFGTFIGALAVILALSTVPATWASQHHALYVLLVVSLVICLVIAVLGPLVLLMVVARFRWMVWRAGAKGPAQARLELMVRPGSPTGARNFIFTTGSEPRRLIPTPFPPAWLRITAPFEAHVGPASPSLVRYGKTIFRVTDFLPTGFVIVEQSLGITIEGEVSYSDLPPRPAAP